MDEARRNFAEIHLRFDLSDPAMALAYEKICKASTQRTRTKYITDAVLAYAPPVDVAALLAKALAEAAAVPIQPPAVPHPKKPSPPSGAEGKRRPGRPRKNPPKQLSEKPSPAALPQKQPFIPTAPVSQDSRAPQTEPLGDADADMLEGLEGFQP